MLGEDFIEALDKETELIYLASPNNPTGQLIPPEILKGILKRCQELDIIVVVDEIACLPFCEEAELYEEMEAGMKCGNLIEVEAHYQDFCHTGSPAGLSYLPEQGSLSEDCKASFRNGTYRYLLRWQDALPAKETEFIGESRKLIKEQRSILTKELISLGFRVYPSQADYILFYTELPLYELLLKKQILIRNCENYQRSVQRMLPDCGREGRQRMSG